MTTATLTRRPSLTRSILASRRPEEHKLVWYAVAAIVLFALAATIVLGAIVWCDLHGKDFGAVRAKNSTTWYVGCH